MDKLKTSFRNLQGAITRITPMAAPICIQHSKTQTLTPEAAEEYDHPPRLEGELDYIQQLHRNSSKRFFFSPRATKSIMEEEKQEPAADKAPAADGKAQEACLWEESRAVSILTEDPLGEFRASMEEMVARLQLTEWRSLQQLLCCYLRLNEKSSHDAIVQAFVDMLMQLMDEDKRHLDMYLEAACSYMQSSDGNSV